MEQQDEQEIWRPIPGFSRYQASSHGRIRTVEERIISRIRSDKGVWIVNIRKDRELKARTRTVPPLIALTFLGPRPKGLLVRHMDLDRLNDREDNLEYATQSTIIKASYMFGRRAVRNHAHGKMLYEDDHAEILRMWRTGKYTQSSLGRELGISNSTVGKIVNGFSHPRRSPPSPPKPKFEE